MSEVSAEKREVRADEREVQADERELRACDREDTASGALRFIQWLIVVLIVLALGSFVRSFVLQDATEKATKAAETAEDASIRAEEASIEAKETSEDTLEELRAIVHRLEAANEGEPDLQNQAILDALAAVARIEGQLCGGACPEPEGGN